MNERKKTNYVLFFSFIACIGMFRILIAEITMKPHRVPHTASPGSMRSICLVLAVGCLLISVAWTMLKTRNSTSPMRFQSNMVLSLAWSNACSIFGLVLFFLGGEPGEFTIYAVGSLLVDLVVILPQVVLRG